MSDESQTPDSPAADKDRTAESADLKAEGADGPKPKPSTSAQPPAGKPAAAAQPPAGKPVAKAAAAKPAAKAAAAKKEAPPDPRVEQAKATADRLRQAVVEQFGPEAVLDSGAAHHKPMLKIAREQWLQVVDYLRTHPDWRLNYVECMAGTDYADRIEVVLFVQSTERGHFVCLKTQTPREEAWVPSLVSAHPGVNWEEREIYDLLGVEFRGHPDLRRIMLDDDFVGHPLRKDFDVWVNSERPLVDGQRP
ncbi:MAG: NADH-quinone oxidoreductase subunit C [Alicyclobacillus herbarius]|uniref:NADH-quinone oxidoreductase subunit C n=1 Tax=Alicyclobacillus herbarius TaxID=122960 RepID=UPI002356A6CC|nr:NADH-quinone oxidoreductase subunit C [Alicyclobacillus herbarius]MCL6632603.1 NADH-quinone oxidoreductase subunit C [Alicyclobacillus herbarius]